MWGTERLTGGAEAAIRSLVANHAIEPTDPARAIPLNWARITDSCRRSTFRTSYSNLLETVENISAASNLGFAGALTGRTKR